jgi:hypothetical protein
MWRATKNPSGDLQAEPAAIDAISRMTPIGLGVLNHGLRDGG